MISIQDLSISFGKKQVLNHLHKDFEESEVHGIIGLNGSGKTTFFNILSAYLKPATGRLLRGKKPMTRNDSSFLETANYFYSNITGREYLKIFPATNEQFNLDSINQLLQLPLNEFIETYSTGMKKKLALLSVIKQDKPVLILDEPFNVLDLETNRVLEIMIGHLKTKGRTIFISSHILSPLISVCDKIHLLRKGSFVKTYLPLQFSEIDKDLFAGFNDRAGDILNNAL